MAILLEFLQSEIFLYLVLCLNLVLNVFNGSKAKKLATMITSQNVEKSDLQALIDYHKKVVQELEKKQNLK